jgi:hypothetical protein
MNKTNVVLTCKLRTVTQIKKLQSKLPVEVHIMTVSLDFKISTQLVTQMYLKLRILRVESLRETKLFLK